MDLWIDSRKSYQGKQNGFSLEYDNYNNLIIPYQQNLEHKTFIA